jgi:hypothetical protein
MDVIRRTDITGEGSGLAAGGGDFINDGADTLRIPAGQCDDQAPLCKAPRHCRTQPG